VFANLNGDPMAPDRLTRMFKKLAAEAGLPPVRLHDLRHKAGCLVLGTRRRPRRQARRSRRGSVRAGRHLGQPPVARRSRAHAARQALARP
jgi:predicted component of type VI protein secretion system